VAMSTYDTKIIVCAFISDLDDRPSRYCHSVNA